jgi:hypothetical protein
MTRRYAPGHRRWSWVSLQAAPGEAVAVMGLAQALWTG